VRERALVVIGLSMGAALLRVAPSSAQDLPRLAVDVQGQCPTQALVMTQLTPLMKESHVDAGAATARVVDSGSSYRIEIGDASRTVEDPERRCLERARVAAVFLALNVPPVVPRVAADEAPAPSPVTAKLERPPPPTRSGPQRALALRAFAGVDWAPSARASDVAFGAGVSGELGPWSATVLGAISSATSPYTGAGRALRYELLRIPLAFLVGREYSRKFFSIGAEAGLAVDILRLRGRDVPNPESSLRLNPGLRLNAPLRLRASARLQAELVPGFSFFPRTYVVRVEPNTELAETPRWWLGLAIGLKYLVWTAG